MRYGANRIPHLHTNPARHSSAYRNQYANSPTRTTESKIRLSISRGTSSYQPGHYEISGQQGKLLSIFKVDAHLGEHANAGEALETWPTEIARLREIRKINKADKLQDKIDTLRDLTTKERS